MQSSSPYLSGAPETDLVGVVVPNNNDSSSNSSISSSMVRTRGNTAASSDAKNQNSSSAQPSHAPGDNTGQVSMGSYREDTPPQQPQPHPYQSIATIQQQQEQQQEGGPTPPSPMVTPPIRSYNAMAAAAASQRSAAAAKKQPAMTAAGVPHIYHDYSRVPDEANYVRKKTGGVTQPFPEKLHEMLNAVEGTADTAIVSWLPHGRAFLVRKPKEFTNTIMPKFFRQTKLTSFQRQLNLYGFRRITQGTDAGAYYHEMFLKARPALCQRMTRQKVKGTGHKQPADVKTEPNFYLMPTVESGVPVAAAAAHNFGSSSAADGVANAPPVFASVFDTGATSRLPSLSALDTPASPGLHGAAHLLQGIASGYGSLQLPRPPTTLGQQQQQQQQSQGGLGESQGTGAAATSSSSSAEQQHQGSPASFLQPRLSKPSSYADV